MTSKSKLKFGSWKAYDARIRAISRSRGISYTRAQNLVRGWKRSSETQKRAWRNIRSISKRDEVTLTDARDKYYTISRRINTRTAQFEAGYKRVAMNLGISHDNARLNLIEYIYQKDEIARKYSGSDYAKMEYLLYSNLLKFSSEELKPVERAEFKQLQLEEFE